VTDMTASPVGAGRICIGWTDLSNSV